MKHSLTHHSAKASHYNGSAEHYDKLNEERSQVINGVIEKILKKHAVKRVLDLTCGTGSQVFYLAKRGYEVVGSDINAKMLKIARSKERTEKLGVQFIKGDMRTQQIEEFDAVVTIFNAVGHLTKLDFEQAMRNIAGNLKVGGLYIFDINNLSYLLKDNNITKLTIDWQAMDGNTKARIIQYSTINEAGILASYTIEHEQVGDQKPKISKSMQTLQVYRAEELRAMLERCGFDVVEHCGIDGAKFVEDETECVLTVARKR